jgi:tetratricopeptide (TPR) repeat protein
MSVLRWVFAVVALAVLLAVADGTVLRLWNMPPRMAIPKPIVAGSELSNLMADARKAWRDNDHRRAAELYTKALAIEPGPNVISQELHALRGSEYNYLNMAKEAFADYDQAISIRYYAPLTDKAIRAYMGRGYAAVGFKQYARAKDDFDVVLKAVPNEVPRSSSTLAWRGAAWQGLRDRERAIADYKAALALDPDNAYARNGLKDLE